MEVCEVAEKHFSGERVTVIHDHGFNEQAQKAFAAVQKHHDPRRSLAVIASMEWRDSTALQAADLIAYEAMKACGRYRSADSAVRRSLQRIIGSGVGLYVSYVTPKLFQDLKSKGVEFRKGE